MPAPCVGDETAAPPRAAMAHVPGGPFLFGPRREVRVLPEFWIDRFPVTNVEFARFAEATGARLPEHFRQSGFLERKRDHPAVGITFAQALACARHAGKDLPTEEEWEKAARGTDGRTYPWGENYEPGRCNAGDGLRRDTTPVGSFPKGTSPFGCQDLAGNVWEWTRTFAGRDVCVVKGGSWFDPPVAVRADRRFTARSSFASASLGFRCVVRSEPIAPLLLEARAPRAGLRLSEGGGEEWTLLLAELRARAQRAFATDAEDFPGIEFAAGELDSILREVLTPEPAPDSPLPPGPVPVPAPPGRARPPRVSRSEVLVGLLSALGTFFGLLGFLA
ncbi:MAG TPA: SUMF1/EgtB/PvdO family nonheme iron enzyme [Planctomycetota bacterium]|nr:SUMF1/EgtB/PvdO family nonheme iron enzyme [Planctomycetota bacterium]